MMIDNALAMSNAQVVTATGNSTDFLDMIGAVNLGSGKILKYILQVSAVSGTTPTMTVRMVGADDAAFSVGVVTLGAIVDNIIAVGLYRIPLANVARKRYVRLQYVIGGTTPSFTVTLNVVRDDEARQTP